MNPWDQFTGANAGYVYELFERYQRDPSSVDEATRRAFANWTLRTRHQRRLKPSLSNRLEATCKRALPHSISPSRFAASVTSPPGSTRSAFTIRLAIRRCSRRRTA